MYSVVEAPNMDYILLIVHCEDRPVHVEVKFDAQVMELSAAMLTESLQIVMQRCEVWLVMIVCVLAPASITKLPLAPCSVASDTAKLENTGAKRLLTH